MITIKYGPWVPDLANVTFQIPDQNGPVTVPVADCLNVIYSNGVYQSINSPTVIATLPGAALGVFTAFDSVSGAVPVVGIGASIYFFNGSSWTSIGTDTGLIGEFQWNFAQFFTQLYGQAVSNNYNSSGSIIPPQLYQFSIQGSVLLIGNAPTAAVMAVVGQFLMMGNISVDPLVTPFTPTQIGLGNGSQVSFSGSIPSSQLPATPTTVLVSSGGVNGLDNGSGSITGTGISSGSVNYRTGAVSVVFTVAPANGIAVSVKAFQNNPQRLHWSAIGDPTNWPVPLTNAALAVQSGINDLESEYGPVMFIAGYPLYGVVFQRNAITRAQYIGGNVVFSWQTYVRNQGLLCARGAVQVGEDTYFISDSGFFSTDGANVVPIGTAEDNSAGIDKWFFSNVNLNALSAITTGYDARLRNVFWAIPTGSNTLPDTLLTYNILAGKWTRSALATRLIWIDSDGFTDRLGIIDQSNRYNLLTGTPASTSYLESCDISFSDGLVRDTNGVRPNGSMTSPVATVGTRNILTQSVTYNAGFAPDAFGAGFAPALTECLYTRIRISGTNASTIDGATCDMVPGGPL